ncbi:MAG: polyphosphate polymerase domain-containing protein [Lachnospiraceae bacterium]|nr:polyphosphate polymerase domain-containing protein [Lachnospiraceae bacterium]
MDSDKHYRHELKYEILRGDYLAIRSRLKHIMNSDPHADENGLYQIRSIYFDNFCDKALREKIEGFAKREKFRIRWYNDDFSFITLEKKMKINNLCLKYDATITEEECHKILNGDIEFLKMSSNELLKELYTKMRYQRLKPRVMVSYVREPYIYKSGNVRVTFDSKVRTSLFRKDFLTEQGSDISATETPEDMILEVKYDAFLPEVIQDIIQGRDMRQQAFSKYGACRRFG